MRRASGRFYGEEDVGKVSWAMGQGSLKGESGEVENR